MLAYAQYSYDKAGAEIGGQAVAIKDPDTNQWHISDARICKGTDTAGNTTMEPESLGVLNNMLMVTHQEAVKEKRLMLVWWHSHHMMQAYWSSTDVETIDDQTVKSASFSLVINLKGEYKLCYAINEPYRIDLDCKLDIKNQYGDDIKKEVDELRSTPVTAITRYRNPTSHRSQMSVFEQTHLQHTNIDPSNLVIADEPESNFTDLEGQDWDGEMSGTSTDEAVQELEWFLEQYENSESSYADTIEEIKGLSKHYVQYGVSIKIPNDIDELNNIERGEDLIIEESQDLMGEVYGNS